MAFGGGGKGFVVKPLVQLALPTPQGLFDVAELFMASDYDLLPLFGVIGAL